MTNEFTRCWQCRAICPADVESGLCDNCRGNDVSSCEFVESSDREKKNLGTLHSEGTERGPEGAGRLAPDDSGPRKKESAQLLRQAERGQLNLTGL